MDPYLPVPGIVDASRFLHPRGSSYARVPGMARSQGDHETLSWCVRYRLGCLVKSSVIRPWLQVVDHDP